MIRIMNALKTLRRSIFLISLPFGILHFVLPIYGKEIGADAIQIGEEIACRYLAGKGFKILATNFYCRAGELDIVARDHDSLAFVEVKSRRGSAGMEQALGPRKIRSLKTAARVYLQQALLDREDYRFMIIYVHLPEDPDDQALVECIDDPF